MKNIIQLAAIPAFAGANLAHGGVYACTNSDLGDAHTVEDLEGYLFGMPETDAEKKLNELFPSIEVGRAYRYYTVQGSAMTETDDSDIRAAQALFKRVHMDQKSKVNSETVEKGLATVIDRSLIGANSSLEREVRKKVKMLRNRLSRIEYVRGLSLLDSAATNQAKTWGASSDPDSDLQDMVDMLNKPQDTVLISRTAWSARRGVYRQKDASNAVFADHARMGLSDVADYIDVSRVIKEDLPIQQGGKGAKATTMTDTVLSYFGGDKSISDAEEIDKLNPTSIANFWSPVDQGSTDGRKWGVLQYENERMVVVAVYHFSQLVATNTENIRKLTISTS